MYQRIINWIILLAFIAIPAKAFPFSNHSDYPDTLNRSDYFWKTYAPFFLAHTLSDEFPLQLRINQKVVSFSYQSSDIYTGKYKNITAKLISHFNKQYHALWYQLILHNDGKDTVSDIRIRPLYLRFHIHPEQFKPRVRYMTGNFHYDGVYPPRAYQLEEREFMTTEAAKPVTISGTAGASAYSYVSMMQFALKNNQILYGFTVGFAWSGGWSITAGWEHPHFENPKPSDFLLTGNMIFGNFKLTPGETITFPKIYFIFFKGKSWTVCSNAMKRYISDKLGYRIYHKLNYNKVTYDSWFGLYGNYHLNDLMQQAKIASELGVEYFCLDAGWYGKGSFHSSNTGQWDEPDPIKFPSGVADIKKLSDYCRKLGMGFGIWHEIDRRNGGGPPFNYAKPKDREIIIKTLEKWITQWHLTWMRWEMAGPVNVKDQLDYWQGYYHVMDTILKEFPGLIIECCSGGGNRFDLGMAHRTASTWLNDQTSNSAICRYMQTGALRFWPSYFLNMAVRVNRHSGDKEATAYNVISRMPGTLSFDGAISEWDSTAITKIRTLVDKYKKIRHLQDQPAFFPLPQPQNSDDWDAVCFGNGSKKQLLYVFRMKGKISQYMKLPRKSKPWKLVMSSSDKAIIKKVDSGYKVFLAPYSVAVWER